MLVSMTYYRTGRPSESCFFISEGKIMRGAHVLVIVIAFSADHVRGAFLFQPKAFYMGHKTCRSDALTNHN